MRGPVSAVLVDGSSMLPTLRAGDCLLVRPGARVRSGDLVVVTFPGRPGLTAVKRAVRPVEGGWWVAGDNAVASNASETYGPAVPVARVLCRYWPLRRRPSRKARHAS